MEYAVTPAPQPAIAVAGGSTLFPVRRIYCVGRNYAEHAREMGGDPDREPPFFFMKPADAVMLSSGNSVAKIGNEMGSYIAYPPMTENLQHEVELVVAIGRPGANIALEAALDHVFGYAVGLDITRRDVQTGLREAGRPWEMAKAFDQSAPVGSLHAASTVGHPQRGAIWLSVNGVERQRSDIVRMIWSVAEIITRLSQYVGLAPGDLIFTGTPEGVTKLGRGDALNCGIDGLGELSLTIV